MKNRLLSCMLLALPLVAALPPADAREAPSGRNPPNAGRNPPGTAAAPPACDIHRPNPYVACTDKLKAKELQAAGDAKVRAPVNGGGTSGGTGGK